MATRPAGTDWEFLQRVKKASKTATQAQYSDGLSDGQVDFKIIPWEGEGRTGRHSHGYFGMLLGRVSEYTNHPIRSRKLLPSSSQEKYNQAGLCSPPQPGPCSLQALALQEEVGGAALPASQACRSLSAGEGE